MKKMYLAVALLASLMFGACSDSDSNDDAYTETSLSEAPVWQVDWNNDQERPDWTAPDGNAYENWTILMIQLEEALQPFASENDLMAIFVNDELRGLAKPAVVVGSDLSGSTKFLMKVWGNETGTETVNISLRYYSQTLNHLFTLADDINLSSDEITGIDEAYIPDFTLGSAKYPVVKMVNVESHLSKAGITPAKGDLLGAFVGDECRGTATLSSANSTSITIYGRNEGERVSLKYYSAEKGILYTIVGVVRM